jgi:hypothetical protein
MADIIEFSDHTDDLDPEEVLKKALEEDLSYCLVLGWTQKNGLWIGTPDVSAGEALTIMELAKMHILSALEAPGETRH